MVRRIRRRSGFNYNDVMTAVVVTLIVKLYNKFGSYGRSGGPGTIRDQARRPRHLSRMGIRSPPCIPGDSRPDISTPASAATSGPRGRTSIRPVARASFSSSVRIRRPLISAPPARRSGDVIARACSRAPTLARGRHHGTRHRTGQRTQHERGTRGGGWGCPRS